MDDISVVEPVTIEVAYRGESLKVSPLSVGQLPSFTRAIRPAFAALAGAVISLPPGDGVGEGGGFIELDMGAVVGLIADHGDAMIDAATIATRKPREFIASGSPVEFMELVQKIVQANADFFAQAVAMMAGAGRKASST